MMTQEYRTAIEERAKIAGVNMSTYAHRCLDSYNASPDQSPTESGANPTSSGEYLTDLGNASTDILFSELEIKNQQIENYNKPSIKNNNSMQSVRRQWNPNDCN